MKVGTVPQAPKITVGDGENNCHYTLVYVTSTRILSFHKTLELDGKKYETLFEISGYSLLRILVPWKKVLLYSLNKYWLSNTINLGKLKHLNMILFPLDFKEDEKKILVEITKGGKKIKMKKEIDIDAFSEVFKSPDEIIEESESAFWVYSTKRGSIKRKGMIMRQHGNKSSRKFYFISNKNFHAFNKFNSIMLYKILQGVQFKNKELIMPQFLERLKEKYSKRKAA